MWGSNSVIYVLDGCFDGEFTELPVPGSGSQSVVVALFGYGEDRFDDRSAVVCIYVESDVVRPIETVRFTMFVDWSDIIGSKSVPEVRPMIPFICCNRFQVIEIPCQHMPPDLRSK